MHTDFSSTEFQPPHPKKEKNNVSQTSDNAAPAFTFQMLQLLKVTGEHSNGKKIKRQQKGRD